MAQFRLDFVHRFVLYRLKITINASGGTLTEHDSNIKVRTPQPYNSFGM